MPFNISKINRWVVNLAKAASILAYVRANAFFRKVIRSKANILVHKEIIRGLSGAHALYIHVPFCREPLCRFCCFVRYPYEEKIYEEYMKALAAEVAYILTVAEDVSVPAVYVGGGTPSVNVSVLADVIETIRDYIGSSVQVSVEVSPRDVNDENVSVLKSVGVNRVSMGVQALTEDRLRDLGKLNGSTEKIEQIVSVAVESFDTVNVDMMWGLQRDTPETIYREASAALDLGASQVTFYPLMPAVGVKKLVKKGSESYWHPKDPEMYAAILKAAFEKGYKPATPWCMDKNSEILEEYIVDFDKFLAAGVSAIGRTDNYVYVNSFSPEKYVKIVEKYGCSAVLSRKTSKSEDYLYSLLSMSFGLELNFEIVERRYGNLTKLPNFLASIFFRTLGGVKNGGKVTISSDINCLYFIHAIQRSVYMAVNNLREWGINTGI